MSVKKNCRTPHPRRKNLTVKPDFVMKIAAPGSTPRTRPSPVIVNLLIWIM
jgi:hypothetical protein